MLFVPAALPIAAPATAPTTEFCAGRDRHRDADARRRSAARSAARRPCPGVGDQRDPAHADRPAAASPPTMNGRSPNRSTSAPAIGATNEQRRRPRQQPQAGVERPVARAPVCRNWAKKNTALNSDANGEEHRRVAGRERARAEEPHRQHRLARARSSQATNAATQQRAGGERADHLGAAPAGGVAAHEPPDDAERRRRSRAPGRGASSAASRAEALRRCRAQHERDGSQPDRHVEPEDPLPGDALR